MVAAPGESINRPPLRMRDLGHDMAGGTKAINSDRWAFAGHHQRPPANEASAQQGSKGGIVAIFAQRKAVARIGNQMAGKAAVARIAGEFRLVAKVFFLGTAVKAFATGEAEPRHA